MTPQYTTTTTDPRFASLPVLPHWMHVGDKRYDAYNQRWVDGANQPTDPPPLEKIHEAQTGLLLQQLGLLVPELQHITNAYKDQTIAAFVRGVLEHVESRGILEKGQQLVETVLDQRIEKKDTDWDLQRMVQNCVQGIIREQVRQKLHKVKNLDRLIDSVIKEALTLESLKVEAHNLITPKMVELIKDLRLELTAGATRRQY